MKIHITALTYVLLAGFAATFFTYYVFFRLLGLLGQTSFVQIGALLTLFSPVIGSILGAYVYFRIKDSFMPDLWKYSILYSLLLSVILEVYFFLFEPVWNGAGLIVGVLSGVTLSLMAYRKSKINY